MADGESDDLSHLSLLVSCIATVSVVNSSLVEFEKQVSYRMFNKEWKGAREEGRGEGLMHQNKKSFL